MLTRLKKTIPLLTSKDQSQIVSAIQLLAAMYELYPNEVEKVWSLLSMKEKERIWETYFFSKFPILAKKIPRRPQVWFYVYLRFSYQPRSGRFLARSNFEITIRSIRRKPNYTLDMKFRNRLGSSSVEHYEKIKSNFKPTFIDGRNIQHDAQEWKEMLDFDMSTFDVKMFYPMLTIIDSPLIRENINEYLSNL
jgi:hypothetical protein